MAYFLGIDTSTTGSKALLIDEHGEVVAVASSPHTLQNPKPLWSEQDPRENSSIRPDGTGTARAHRARSISAVARLVVLGLSRQVGAAVFLICLHVVRSTACPNRDPFFCDVIRLAGPCD